MTPGLNKYIALIVLGISCLLVTIFLIIFYNPSFFTEDTAQYLSASSNFLQGHGFSTSILYYEENYQINQLPAYQTVFPPGYPALISFFVFLGTTPQTAVFTCTLLSHLASVIVLFFILARVKGNAVVHFFLCCLWLFSTSCWLNILKGLSEMPFICCTLLSFLCYAVSFDRHKEKYIWLFLAGVFAAASFLMRYAGIFYAASLILSTVCLTRHQDIKQKLIAAVAAGSAPVTVIGLILYKNYSLTGDAKGGNPEVLTTSISDVVMTFYYSLSQLTGLSVKGLKEGRSPELFFLLGCILCGLLFFKYIFSKKPNVRHIKEALWNPFVFFPLTYTVVTVLALAYLEKTTAVGLNARMLLPLVPFLLILVQAMSTKLLTKKFPRLIAYFFLILFIFTQKTIWKTGRQDLQQESMNYHTMVSALDEKMSVQQSVIDFLNKNLSERCPVFSNNPQQLGLLLNKPILGIPGAVYSSQSWDSNMVYAAATRYKVGYFILFERLNKIPTEKSQFWNDIKAGDIPIWLTPLYSSDRIKIYKKIVFPATEVIGNSGHQVQISGPQENGRPASP